jgi:regulator of PEP synthase PpsR (kinase-PPPase family)
MLMIFVVSDATGETAERMVRSALVQFEGAPARVIRRGDVRTPEKLRAVVQEAAGHRSLILHTLVSNELRRLMLPECRSHGVDAMDLMGPMLERLATHLRLTPQEKPGLFKQLVEARSRQVEAVEFAFRHDDGQRADELGRAEVVLVGVSRTMKTPTTVYLGYQG